MPAPAHEGDELIRIDAIANRNKDAGLLQYVYAHSQHHMTKFKREVIQQLYRNNGSRDDRL